MSQIISDRSIDILVTGGCNDCPFKDSQGVCNMDRSTKTLDGYPGVCLLIDKNVTVERKKGC